jgi:hypothetical protein
MLQWRSDIGRNLWERPVRDRRFRSKKEGLPMTRISRIGLVAMLVTLPTAIFANTKVLPQLTGSLEPFTILPVSDELQSICLSEPERRGFVEFIVPSLPGHIGRAILVLTETRGFSAFPVPPTTHELSYYAGDLALDGSDFDKPTTLITTFQTDVNEPGATFKFDVTSIVQSFEGRILGFRVRMQPGFDCSTGGSAFGSLSTIPPVIEIRGGFGSKS